MRITLRIKKIYFDKIERGEKLVEYRAVKPYYDRLIKSEIKEILFHYQIGPKLLVKVDNIRKIKTPKRLLDGPINFGSHVYAIYLSEPKRVA